VPVTRRLQLVALALDRENGDILWTRNLREWLPHEDRHYSGAYAAASPVVDGEHLYAFFGSGGLFCLDHDGYVLWNADLGEMQVKHAHGEGGSPALHGDTVVINWDHEGDSFVVAFDADTGEERWKVARDEPTSWASPLIVEQDDEVQVVISAANRVRGYNLATGEVLWECAGMSHNVVATPVAANGMLFAASSYERQALLAIRLEGARGDITETDHVVWYRRRSTPYVPSPLLYGEALYFFHHYQGKLTRVIAETGEELHRPLRIDGLNDIYASPVGAADRIYVVDRSGEVAVLSHEEQPKVLARNVLEDSFSASPVLVERDLYLRGERFLYCISEQQSEK
jgi:outer membrane protein assembly factor BamB